MFGSIFKLFSQGWKSSSHPSMKKEFSIETFSYVDDKKPSMSKMDLTINSIANLFGFAYEPNKSGKHSSKRHSLLERLNLTSIKSHKHQQSDLIDDKDGGQCSRAAFQFDKSYYHVGQFKPTINRLDAAKKSLNQLEKMVEERAELERIHSNSLKEWSNKWLEEIKRNDDYGTSKATIYNILQAAIDVEATRHQNLANLIHGNVLSEILRTKKKLFSKSKFEFGKCKTRLDFIDCQRRWSQILDSVEAAKAKYKDAFLKFYAFEKNTRIMTSDQGMSARVKVQYQRETRRLKAIANNERLAYRKAVDAARRNQEIYIERMNLIYGHLDSFEKVRLEHLRQVFSAYTFTIYNDEFYYVPSTPSQNEDSDFTDSYQVGNRAESNPMVKRILGVNNVNRDLHWFSNTYGPGTIDLAEWPKFEECMQDRTPSVPTPNQSDQISTQNYELFPIEETETNYEE
ncbi:hypothetical protein ACOME3_004360 [Neoechinorhynchus agilis]